MIIDKSPMGDYTLVKTSLLDFSKSLTDLSLNEKTVHFFHS